MDSEGSEIDELADIDLATFATHDQGTKFHLKVEESGWNDGLSTDTEGDSLGNSMDSRASSDMVQHYEVSRSLDDSTNERDGDNHANRPGPFDGPPEMKAKDSFAHDIAMDTKIDSQGITTASGIADHAKFSTVQPAPGRAGYIQQNVPLKRLPGENLGMVLAIEGDQDNARPVEAVLVRSITPGGAAARAGEGGSGIQVGDEVREVDGCLLTDLTHDQCIELFQGMPDHVMLTLHRAAPQVQFSYETDQHSTVNYGQVPSIPSAPVPRPRAGLSHSKASDTEESLSSSVNSTPRQEEEEGFMRTPRGFVKLDMTVFRGDGDNLGLSIIPSHGATCDLYQVKRLLPGGACHESGCLEVHDRLLYCNGLSLKGLTQAQCLQVLKSSGHFVELTILRQIDAAATQPANKATGEVATDLPDPSTANPISEGKFAPEVASLEQVTKPHNFLSEEHIEYDTPFSPSGSSQRKVDIFYVPSLNQGQSEQYIARDFVSEEEESVHDENQRYEEHFDSGYDTIGSVKKTRLEDTETDNLIGTIINLDDETKASVQETHPSTEVSVQEINANRSLEVTSLIPPPVQFSDGLKSDESAQPTVENYQECVTNIDDILFDVKEIGRNNDKSFIELHSEEYRGIEQRPVLADSFTGNTVEEFAEQCFNNIENYSVSDIDNTPENHQNEGVLVAARELNGPSLDSFGLNETNSQITEKGLTEVQPTLHISTISVSTSTPPQFSNSAHVTNIDVSSSDLIKLNDSTESEQEGFTITECTTEAREAKNVTDDSSARLEILELFGSFLPSSNTMSHENTEDSATHTTLGVVTLGKDAEEEETIQPMVAVKNAQGKVLAVKKAQESVNSSNLSEERQTDIKQKLESVREMIQFPTSNGRNSQPVVEKTLPVPHVEEDIVPTKLDRAQKETVLHVLNTWAGKADESEEKVSLQDIVAHFKGEKVTPPENASVVHTIGAAATGSDDELIRPMSVTRDHLGKSFCVPVSLTEVNSKPDISTAVEKDRSELANIALEISKLADSRSLQSADPTDGILVEEEHVIPATRNTDHQLVLDGIIKTVIQKEHNSHNDEGKAVSIANADREEQSERQNLKEQDHAKQEHVTLLSRSSDDATDTEKVKSTQNGIAVDGEEIVRASTVISVQCTPNKLSENVSTVVIQDSVESPTENRKSTGFFSAVRTFESGGKEQLRQSPVALRHKVKDLADVQSVVSKFEKPENPSNQDEQQVVMRPKTTRSSDFRANIESFQAQDDAAAAAASKTYVSSARPKSMVEVTASSSGRMPLSKIGEIRKSFDTEPRLNPALRRLSAATPLGGNTSAATRRISTGSRAFSGGMFSGTRSPRANLPHSRQDDGSPFQVDVLKGILGLGLKVKVTPEGQTKVTDIQKGSPIEKDGQIRVGDIVTSINSTELTGQSEVRVQQIIRLLPRGLVKLVVHSPTPGSGSSSSTAPPDDSEVENDGDGETSTQVSDGEKESGVQTSTRTFLLSGNKVEHISGNNDQDSTPGSLAVSSDSRSTPSTQPPLTARVEISSNITSSRSGNLQATAPLKIAIKPTATPRPANLMNKALAPRSPSLPTTVESAESPKDESTPPSRGKEIVDSTEQLRRDETTPSPPEQRRSIISAGSRNPRGTPSFKNNRDMFEQKSAMKDPEIQKPKSLFNINREPTSNAVSQVSATINENHTESPQKIEKESTSLSITIKPQDSDNSRASPSEKIVAPSHSTNVEEQLSKTGTSESSHSPVQKTPPPVAPKPRLSSSSSAKSEGNEELEEVVKPKLGPKISSGYERLQAITKTSKPSKIIEKSRSYVSSRAKMFDAKTDEASSSAAPEAASRRISVGGYGQQDPNSGSLNTSLKPVSERRKSTGSGLITKPLSLTQQFSAAPKPTARSFTSAKRPTEITIPETSPRDIVSEDSKIKSVVSPTRLNSALSPRRTSSAESPLSPPLTSSPRQVPSPKQVTSPRERKSGFIGDKYQSSSPNARDNSGTFKYSSVTVHDTESPPKTSPENPTSPSQSPHQKTSSYHISKTFTSPASVQPSPNPDLTSQVSEEHLENTMKMFDDLLMDAPIVHSESDPVDLLLWAPVRMDSPRSPRTDSLEYTAKTEQSPAKAPIAKPRSKPVEVTLHPTEAKLNNTVSETPKEECFNVETFEMTSKQSSDGNTTLQKLDALKQQKEQASNVHDISMKSGEEIPSNIVTMQVSESMINIQAPKEKQTVKIHRILSNHTDENLNDNLVAAHVSEAIFHDEHKKKKQDCDVHSRLKYVSEKDFENNIVAVDIVNNISENSSSKQRQTANIETLLIEVARSDTLLTDNIPSMQIAESLEKDFKASSDIVSTNTEMPSNNDDENLVADNLSKDMAFDSKQLNQQSQGDHLNEFRFEENSSRPQVYSPPLTKGDSENGAYREHAQKIVEVVLAKATTDPTVNTPLNEDVDADADDEEEPPPLPGAPPPPLILRNPVMLVSAQDLFDQGGVPVVPEGLPSPSSQQKSSSSSGERTETFEGGNRSRMVVDTAQMVGFETSSSEYPMSSSTRSPSTEMVSGSDSVEPLNSTGGSISEGESHRLANSRSPDDMLSEDSGMPGDEEFPEVATDDAISPPGELAETELALRSVNTALLSSAPVTLPEDQSHEEEKLMKPAVCLELNTNPPIPFVEVCDTSDDLPPPLPTTSLPQISIQSPPFAEPDVSLPQTSCEDSSSLPLSKENPLLGDEVTFSSVGASDSLINSEVVFDKEETSGVQEDSTSLLQHVSEEICENDNVSINILEQETNVDKAVEVEDQSIIVQTQGKESVSSEEAESEDIVSVTSKRKWCFRSNSVETSPLLKAEAGVNAILAYPDPSLVTAAPPADLASLLEKANVVLDSAGASVDLELCVVHLCRQAESRDLGVDLKHDGSIWFRVSKLVEGSPAKLEGGVEVGDWLLALDSLWCDQVTVMRLLARLTKPKRDSLLVLAKGESSVAGKQDKISSADSSHRPTPAPRPRSAIQTVPDEPQQVPASSEATPSNKDRDQNILAKPAAQAPELQSSPPSLRTSVDNILHPAQEISAPRTEEAVIVETQGSSDFKDISQELPQDVIEASPADDRPSSGIFKVVMVKGATGVGFCLEGGKGSPKGDVPIIIKRIFKGGPAEKCGQLKVKDEILEVNGVDFRSMRHYEAWNHLKFLDDGEVCLTLRRDG